MDFIGLVFKEKDLLQKQLRREPTIEEIAIGINSTPTNAIRAMKENLYGTISLETPAGEDGNSVLCQFIENETSLIPSKEVGFDNLIQ